MKHILCFISIIFIHSVALADNPCQSLNDMQKKVVDDIFRTQHPYDQCDDTFEQCLKREPVPPLVRRLADWICRKASKGEDEKGIRRSLEKRGLSMMKPNKTYNIDTSSSPLAGCKQGKVVVTSYVCARCPFCSKLIPHLHREVTNGRLSGRVALYFKLFPIKSHEHSIEANMAVSSAIRMGKGWEYLLRAYSGFDSFSVDMLPIWAKDVGLDANQFQHAMNEPSTKEYLVESKKEGLRNGVESTPTFFINGRRWYGDLDLDTLIDVIEEEAESIK